MSLEDVGNNAGAKDCGSSVIDLDLVRDRLLTDWTLSIGWVLDKGGVEEVVVEVGLSEELAEGPIVPDGSLFSAT